VSIRENIQHCYIPHTATSLRRKRWADTPTSHPERSTCPPSPVSLTSKGNPPLYRLSAKPYRCSSISRNGPSVPQRGTLCRQRPWLSPSQCQSCQERFVTVFSNVWSRQPRFACLPIDRGLYKVHTNHLESSLGQLKRKARRKDA
jgi:hypothetical protein